MRVVAAAHLKEPGTGRIVWMSQNMDRSTMYALSGTQTRDESYLSSALTKLAGDIAEEIVFDLFGKF
ncbi:MAG: hypothetical protein AB1896_18275 [Thermodesulfobacteriota bacterium]